MREGSRVPTYLTVVNRWFFVETGQALFEKGLKSRLGEERQQDNCHQSCIVLRSKELDNSHVGRCKVSESVNGTETDV